MEFAGLGTALYQSVVQVLTVLLESAALVFFGVVAWGMTHFARRLLEKLPKRWQPHPLLIALIIGQALAFGFRVDIFREVGYEAAHVAVANLFSGLLVSIVAMFINEWYVKKEADRRVAEVEAAEEERKAAG